MKGEEILRHALAVFEQESAAIASLKRRLGPSFLKAIQILEACEGRVVVTGMGKSGLIGKKIAATFSSTGTPSLFLHPAEGVHGDLGMIARGDVVLCISNSGETQELLNIVWAIRRLDTKLVGLVGNPRSTLAQRCDVVLDVSVEAGLGALRFLPTSSTAATLAMGDALAVALMAVKGFTADDFVRLHPGGALGTRLLVTAEQLMHTGDAMPQVSQDAAVKDVIYEISSKQLGVTTVVDESGTLRGIITDGDLRRLFEKTENPYATRARDFMTPHPKLIRAETLALDALETMETYSITSLVVVDEQQRPLGLLHIHSIIRSGVV